MKAWNPIYILITTGVNITGNNMLYDSFVTTWSTSFRSDDG
jgi:hypothetical protein